MENSNVRVDSANRLGRVLMDNPNLIQPFGNYIVIKIMDIDETSVGGVFLPDELRGRDRQILARVISVGPGQRSITTGERMQLQCSEGDLVLILKHAPIEIKLAGKVCHVIAEGDVIGRIDEEELENLLMEVEQAPDIEGESEVYDVGEGVQARVEKRESGLFLASTVGD